jgi:hypothetical protein
VEVFLTGKGLPVTDLEFGQDGAMYFTIGGRGTQAGLYRVSWTGQVDNRANLAVMSRGVMGERETLYRRRLELEAAPVAEWRADALKRDDPQSALTALLALARVGTKEDQAAILQALAKFPLDSLQRRAEARKAARHRSGLARHGRPSPELVQMGLEKLSRQYPAKTFALNRELCALLVWLTGDQRSGDIPVAVIRDSGSQNAGSRRPPRSRPPRRQECRRYLS